MEALLLTLKEASMKNLMIFVIGSLFGVADLLIKGAVLTIAWNALLVASFDIVTMTFLPAVGLMLIVKLLIDRDVVFPDDYNPSTTTLGDIFSIAGNDLAKTIAMSIMYLFMISIISLLMAV